MAGVGEQPKDLARSPFVEKLKARGYEVLLLNLPSDEPMMGALDNFMWVESALGYPREFKADIFRGMKTQDVSKKGLKYGDEDEDEAEKKELEAQKIAFAPLIDWLKKELKSDISDGEFINLTQSQSFSKGEEGGDHEGHRSAIIWNCDVKLPPPKYTS